MLLQPNFRVQPKRRGKNFVLWKVTPLIPSVLLDWQQTLEVMVSHLCLNKLCICHIPFQSTFKLRVFINVLTPIWLTQFSIWESILLIPIICHATSFVVFPIKPYVNICVHVYHVKVLKCSSWKKLWWPKYIYINNKLLFFKNIFFLEMELCSLVDVYHSFRATYCFCFHGTLKTKVVSSSETLGNVSKKTQNLIPIADILCSHWPSESEILWT